MQGKQLHGDKHPDGEFFWDEHKSLWVDEAIWYSTDGGMRQRTASMAHKWFIHDCCRFVGKWVKRFDAKLRGILGSYVVRKLKAEIDMLTFELSEARAQGQIRDPGAVARMEARLDRARKLHADSSSGKL